MIDRLKGIDLSFAESMPTVTLSPKESLCACFISQISKTLETYLIKAPHRKRVRAGQALNLAQKLQMHITSHASDYRNIYHKKWVLEKMLTRNFYTKGSKFK